MQPINGHELYGVCHEMTYAITPIFKSTPNLKAPPLCQSCQYWLALNAVHLKSINQPRLHSNNRVLCLKMPLKRMILSLLTNMLSTHQADCYWVTRKNSLRINSMVAHCFMMLLLVLFGPKIKSHLELEKFDG